MSSRRATRYSAEILSEPEELLDSVRMRASNLPSTLRSCRLTRRLQQLVHWLERLISWSVCKTRSRTTSAQVDNNGSCRTGEPRFRRGFLNNPTGAGDGPVDLTTQAEELSLPHFRRPISRDNISGICETRIRCRCGTGSVRYQRRVQGASLHSASACVIPEPTGFWSLQSELQCSEGVAGTSKDQLAWLGLGLDYVGLTPMERYRCRQLGALRWWSLRRHGL